MPTILIGGYYGAGNVGDEAILVSMLGELRLQSAHLPDLSFIVLSWNPEKTSAELGVQAIHWQDVSALVEAALRSDLIILGGGGIFHDYWGLDPETYLRKGSRDITAFGSLPLLAHLLGIPCMIYAVGVGPFQTDLARQHTRLAFERCQVATVRDEESLEYLRGTGFDFHAPGGPQVLVLPDPVFTLPTSPLEEMGVTDYLDRLHIDGETPLLGVSLRYWDLECPPEEWRPFIANGLWEFLDHNRQAHVLTIPFQVLHATPHTNDAIVLKKLADLIALPGRVHTIEEPLTPAFVQALIKRCRVIVGMRLHSAIMGMNVGTPVVALSYAPKVLSVMKLAGLGEFCNPSLTPRPSDLAAQIQKAWDGRPEFVRRMQPIQASLAADARRHASLALDLLSRSRRPDLQFSQQFALDLVKQLEKADEARLRLENDNLLLQSQVGKLETESLALQAKVGELDIVRAQLYEIQSSFFWKLVRLPHRFTVTLKHEGLGMALRKTLDVLRLRRGTETVSSSQADQALGDILARLNARPLKGVFVVTSAFAFDELYNQRVINLSKFLARQGWSVVYVAWVWHGAREAPPGEVMENIFQVPSNLFLAGYSTLQGLQLKPRFFVVEFPHPEFLTAAIRLRTHDFRIVYENIDNWEEFHKVGQAGWFTASAEKGLVVNANFLTAVSRPLVEKFSSLRRDIHLIPNGFDPALLGGHQDVADKKFSQSAVQLGYFGHLTDSWFDWDFLLEVLDLAAERGLDLEVHLIGYGQPNLEHRLAKYRGRLHLHGKVQPAGLHAHARGWNVAMIPFKPGKLSEAVDPIKIYEYLYFGLPVIVKGIPHLKDLPGVSVVDSAGEFLDAISRLRQGGPAEQAPGVLLEHTWERRFTKFLDILEGEEWMSL